MGRTGYTVLGWIVWQIGSRVAKRKVAENRTKLAAAAALGVLALGVGVALAASGGDEE